ncbi:MAG: IS630 family transposase, partial [Legionella sp.]|nr:IS630 family transposase [Legionella sp.]
LDRRIPDKETFIREISEWNKQRNAEEATIDWQFTTADARVKLKRLYPVFNVIGQNH